MSRATTSERAASEVRRRIWTGEFASGSRLHQDELAATLGVSRIPVREALITLAHEGTVRMEPHRGAFVTPVDEASVRDHYELFAHLDCFALAKTVERAEEQVRRDLGAEMAHAGTADDVDGLHRIVTRARARIHELGGSPRFDAVAAGLRGLVPGNFFAEVPGAAEIARRWLPQVGTALASGDADGAIHAYREMLHEHADRVVAVLSERSVLVEAREEHE